MSKVLIFSDLHLHPHKRSADRLNDCLKVLDWVFETRKERNIKNILFLGDLFHDREKIDILTYQRTFEIFEKYCDGSFQIHLLLGNHDLWNYEAWDISSVFPLRSVPGVKIVDRPCTLDIAETQISFLPYTHDPEKDLKLIKNNSKFKILCAHLAIHGANLNKLHSIHAQVSIEHDGEMKLVDASVFEGWDQTFLGHYHGEQKLSDNVEYVGSPLQLTFSEAFQHKHILVYDLETHDKEYIRNTFSPQHLIIKAKDVEKYDLNNKFLCVMTDDVESSEIVELRHNLLKENDLRTLVIEPIKKEDKEHIITDAKSIFSNQEEMIKTYIDDIEKTVGLNGLDKTKLIKVLTDICNRDKGVELEPETKTKKELCLQ